MPGPNTPALPGFFIGPPTPFRPVDVYGTPKSAAGVQGASPLQTTARYVRKTGSDANGGTSPADAWLTINKALTTASPGTVIYVGAGTYREVVSITITPTPGLPVSVVADVTGQFTGDAGPVILTAYLTNDKTAPSATTLLNLNGKSNLTFQNIMFVGGSATLLVGSSSQNIVFRGCSFLAGFTGLGLIAQVIVPYGMQANWLFDRCVFLDSRASNGFLTYTLTTGGGSDYDANILHTNCQFLNFGGGTAIAVVNSGSAAGKGGGVRVRNSTSLGSLITTSPTNISLSIPSVVTGCFVYSGQLTCLVAGTSGQIVEDYNLFVSSSARSNVTVGTHSVSDGSYSPLLHFGQEALWGGALRPLGEPMVGSPLLAFGAPDTAAGLLDLRRGPRPSTAAKWDVGAIQRGNNLTKETGTVHTGSNAISLVGEGFQDFDLAVDAGALTVSVYVQYDGSYVGPLPSMQIVNGGQVGVGDVEFATTTAALNGWAQIQITINPTSAGIVTVRLISRDTSGAGHTYFDTFAVA
jgi:hypothetical protein